MKYYTRVVVKHPKEKTLYLAGDTVWYEGVQEVISTHKLEGGTLVGKKISMKWIRLHQTTANHTHLKR